MAQIDPEKEDDIKANIAEYHTLLQRIESAMRKQIDQCREPLLLPLLPIGHEDQFIPKDGARDVHRALFTPKMREELQSNAGKRSKLRSNSNQKSANSKR